MILLGVRRGTLSDRHIGVRAQRTRPLTLGLVSVLVGLTLLLVLGAPRELIALVVASFAGGAVGTAINHFWKMSVHASVAAGSAVILAFWSSDRAAGRVAGGRRGRLVPASACATTPPPRS